ncbi:uncharacterized protein H6S33_012745 [Morchella sextelata]|uniref:uncharacterized protein n=1 Tax=Morchella sextelata TaxID=1174677 RepID=UPI001D0404A8|nr:uncharacterized protein H6S33_012745 [Morchella sextelata]KAH0609259.1 hypothetical protein H6S33_012745 [Morchella sextelata]
MPPSIPTHSTPQSMQQHVAQGHTSPTDSNHFPKPNEIDETTPIRYLVCDRRIDHPSPYINPILRAAYGQGPEPTSHYGPDL